MRVHRASARVLLALLLSVAAPDRGTAQDTVPPLPTFTLTGQIVDALNDAPVVSAVIKAPELRRYAFSNTNGRFRFADFPEGTWNIVVEMLGYHSLDGSITVAEGNGLLLRLNPDPIALEGLRVRNRAEGLLDRRRRRYPFRVTTISAQTLADAVIGDPAAIFRRNANAPVVGCADRLGQWITGGCYWGRRARRHRIQVFLDEGLLPGGMWELSMFPKEDIHSMDWLKDTGELHVYTTWFIERLNRSRTRLAPFKWPIP